jgi:hypothetical protein
MSKISLLPQIATADIDGTETLPVVKSGITKRLLAGTLVQKLAQPFIDLAKGWADGAAPGGAGTKSSREWALTSQASASALAAGLDKLTVTGSQQMGRPVAPVTGPAASALALTLSTPVAAAPYPGVQIYLETIKFWQLSATAPFVVYKRTKSGNDFTTYLTHTAMLNAANNGSLVTLTGASFGLTADGIPFSAGDYAMVTANSLWPGTDESADVTAQWATSNPANTTQTIAAWSAGTRLQMQLNFKWVYQVVNKDTFLALQASVVANAATVATFDTAIGLLKTTVSGARGRPAGSAFVDAAAATVNTLVWDYPIEEDTTINTAELLARTGGAVKIGRATGFIGALTVKQVSNSVTVATGTKTIGASGPSDFGTLNLAAGDRLVMSAPNVIALPTATDDTDGWSYTNVTIAADAALGGLSKLGGSRPEVRFNLSKSNQPVTAGAIQAMLNGSIAPTDPRSWQPRAEMLGILIDGQSLTRGHDSGTLNGTAPQGPYALKFNGGVRADDGGATASLTHASLVALTETTFGNLGETPASGMARMLKQLFLADGIDITTWGRSFLFSAPGASGTLASGLMDGTAPFQRLRDDITFAPAAAAAYGRPTYAPLVMCQNQGQQEYASNTPEATWERVWRGIRTMAQVQARLTTGIPDLVLPMIMTQISSHLGYGRAYPSIALRQTALHASEKYAVACPEYFLPPNVNSPPHLVSNGYEWLGAYWAVVLYNWIWKGKKPPAMQPIEARRYGNCAVLKYPVQPGKKMAIDTTLVAEQTRYGWLANDPVGAALTITDVRAVSDSIVLDFGAVTPPIGSELRYAFGNTSDTTPVFGKGNIRDNSGDSLIYAGSANLGNKPMHNFGLHSKTVLTS